MIQRASSDLRCNPHFHTVLIDGVYLPEERAGPPTFHATSPPSQAEVAAVVLRASQRIARFLQERGLIALATAPGDDEVSGIVGDESLGEDDPLLAQLLAAATAGLPPAGPAHKRAPVRLVLPEGASPTPKGRL